MTPPCPLRPPTQMMKTRAGLATVLVDTTEWRSVHTHTHTRARAARARVAVVVCVCVRAQAFSVPVLLARALA